MKDLNFRKPLTALCLAFACATMVGCLTEDRRDSRTVIEGEVGGEDPGTGGPGSGFSGAVVTLHPVSATGELEPAIDSTTVKADGRFRIISSGGNLRDLVLRVRKGDTVWMALFAGTPRDGMTSSSRPIDLESTIEVDVWLQLLKTEQGRQVGYPEVAIAIDAAVASAARVEYRGTPAVRTALVVRLAAAIRVAAAARDAYLANADSGYSFKRPWIDSARTRAAVELQDELHAAAGDTNKIRVAERDYRRAVLQAYMASGITATTYARSADAAYRALVAASRELSDSVRVALARNYARLLAGALSGATEEEFDEAGGTASGLALVVDAGELLLLDIEVATGIADLDSALAKFSVAVRAAVLDSNSGFGPLLSVIEQINLDNLVEDLLDTVGSLLGGLLGGGAPEDVGAGLADALEGLTEELLANLSGLAEPDQAEALANLLSLLLLSPQGS